MTKTKIDFGDIVETTDDNKDDKDEKTTVIGKPAEDIATTPIGVDDPPWIVMVKEAYPKNLTFHALIRAIYSEVRRTEKNEKKSRALAIIGAAKKVFGKAEIAQILDDLDEDGKLRDALTSVGGEADTEIAEIESDVLASLDD